MIGFSVFLCKEKIAIIKRKREKGHVDLSSSTFEGKKKTENGTKRLIFTAVSILLEIVFLLFLFTKVSEYATGQQESGQAFLCLDFTAWIRLHR